MSAYEAAWGAVELQDLIERGSGYVVPKAVPYRGPEGVLRLEKF